MGRHWICSVCLLLHSVTDVRERRIYTAVLLVQAAAGIGLCCYLRVPWMQTAFAAAPGLCFLVCGKLTEEKIGYGDGWLLVVCALYETPDQLYTQLFIACLAAFIYGLFLWFIRREKGLEIPFAPFLLLGYIGGFAL